MRADQREHAASKRAHGSGANVGRSDGDLLGIERIEQN